MVDGEVIDPTAWEPLPTYMELLSKTALSVYAFNFNASNCYTVYEDWDFAKSLLMDVPRSQVMLLAAITTTLTVMRAVMSAWIFEPLSRWLRLTPSDSAKFPESAWKLLVCSILWAFSFEVIVISERHDYLQRPTRIWNFSVTADHYTQPLPGDIYWMYILQLSFYMHSIYATIYMDVWRKDSVTMLFHHGITIFLLQFSFLVKYHKIGSLVLFLHDISDVFLEFTKINVYLKHRGRRFHAANDILSSIGFVAFAGSWAFFRLYWFPLKVLYSATYGVYLHHQGTKGPRLFIYFNIMLWLLLALHVYWFWFILVLMYRIATGQMKELDDTREYDSGCGSSGEESAAELVAKGDGPRVRSSHGSQNGGVRHGRKERNREHTANGSVARRPAASRVASNGKKLSTADSECDRVVVSNGTPRHIGEGREGEHSVDLAGDRVLNGSLRTEEENPTAGSEHDQVVANGISNKGDESPERNGVCGGECDGEIGQSRECDGDVDDRISRPIEENGTADSDSEDGTRERLLNGNTMHTKE